MSQFPLLFEAGTIGSVSLANRIVKSPQTTGLANPDGSVTDRLVRHYRRLAQGGAGLIIAEYTYIDEDASKSIHCQLGASREDHIAGLGWLVEVVHAEGAKIGLQLEHCGAQKFLGIPPIKAPSAVPWPELYDRTGLVPEVLSLPEIKGIIQSFGAAAFRAWQAGFDLVEIHGAHGYLITEFLSPVTNRRSDLYGGPLANRMRFLLEVIREMRSRVPADYPITVRLSDTDNEPNGITVDETVEVSRCAVSAGVSAIHVSGGNHHTGEWQWSGQLIPLAPHADAAGKIKVAVAVPVIVSGSIPTPAMAEDLLGNGVADFVGVGRPLLADPHWPNKARSGQVADIRPCIRCNEGCLERSLMLQRSVSCSVNPTLGHEEEFDLRPVSIAMRVAVIGGGPAGLEAATGLAERGHHPTLFADEPLGGGLRASAAPAFKHDLARYLEYLTGRITRLGIDVLPALAPDGLDVLREFDHVVLALGREPRPLDADIHDGARLASVRAALLGTSQVNNAVVVGGGHTGVQTALTLAQAGSAATLVERKSSILEGAFVTDLHTYPLALRDAGVRLMLNSDVIQVHDWGVELACASGTTSVKADAVFAAVGWVPRRSFADAVHALGVPYDVIGSARQVGTLHDAIHEAHALVRRL
jgi:2,4-dienoyl-CoA reductase-like NADH-dependent reductase (Old Yellow Enzyme family)/NADPH-dependent 2,4-dienoyl-CoA reductase/sulfur reductase-like enzyme